MWIYDLPTIHLLPSHLFVVSAVNYYHNFLIGNSLYLQSCYFFWDQDVEYKCYIFDLFHIEPLVITVILISAVCIVFPQKKHTQKKFEK